MIFSDFVRGDDSPKTNRESDFAFLNRSARPEMVRMRDFIAGLVETYPQSDVKEMIARIKSGHDGQFRSAGFELLVYQFLTRLGFKLQPHPELKNGSKTRPDFHVIAPNGAEFYLEAVLASQDNGENPSANAMIGTTLDILDSEAHPNFYVSVVSDGEPKTQPSGKRLQRATMKWLNSLDPDEVAKGANAEGYDAIPRLEWQHEDWHVELRPIPVKKECRGLTKRLIGMRSGGAGFIDSWTPIRDAISFKGQRYGDLDLPLLVAVNFGSFTLDRADEMQALYGEEQYVFSSFEPEQEPQFRRKRNGAWNGPNGPRAKRVSGAWLFNDLSFFTVAGRSHTVYFNAWATYALPDDLRMLPCACIGEDERVHWSEGASLCETFGLVKGWPIE